MLPRTLIASLSCAAALAAAAPAGATTYGFGELRGNTEPAPLGACPQGDATVVGGALHDIDVSGPAVLTAFKAQRIGVQGAALTFRVARSDRSAGGNAWQMVAGVPAKLGPDGSVEILTRIPVQNTDRLALSKPAGSQVACALEIQGENPFVAIADGPAPDGATTAFTTVMDRYLPIAARVETDADGDGFGDDTQDECIGVPGPRDGCEGRGETAATRCTVPLLRGLPLAKAKRRLTAAGCRVGAVRRRGRGRLVVRRQSVAAGTQSDAGTKVDLNLGPKRG